LIMVGFAGTAVGCGGDARGPAAPVFGQRANLRSGAGGAVLKRKTAAEVSSGGGLQFVAANQ
jgi:hypothetical protein